MVNYSIKSSEKIAEETLHIPFGSVNRLALQAQHAVIRDNVSLITDITSRMEDEILGDVLQAVMWGRDIKYLRTQLHKVHEIELRRADRIARDQVNKATSAISTAKQLDCGIVENMWRHSHGDKVPRQSHLDASGKIFDLDKGCLIDGQYIYPAEKINCSCYSVPVLKLD
jgi:uncharacterized protein with gpF-like domain